MFTPSDGITLYQQTPLNKWAKLVPDLTKALADAGFKKGDINHTTSDSLAKQSRAIQDFVVDHLSNNTTDDSGIAIAPDNMTLLVAPVVEADASTRQYGDYVSQNLSTNDVTDEEATSDGEFSEDDSSKTTRPTLRATALHRTSRRRPWAALPSLKLAKESGMHAGLLATVSRDISRTPSSSSRMPRPSGSLQAGKRWCPNSSWIRPVKTTPNTLRCCCHTPPWTKKATPMIPNVRRRGVPWYLAGTGLYYQKGVVESPSGTLDGKSTGKRLASRGLRVPLRKAPLRKCLKRLAKTDGKPDHPVLTASSR